MASACVKIIIKDSSSPEKVLYALSPYKYEILATGTNDSVNTKKIYSDTQSYENSSTYTYSIKELVLTQEQKRRLEEVNSIIESYSNVNLAAISNHLQEVSDYVECGFISPKTNSTILTPLSDTASPLVRFKFNTQISSYLKALRKDKINNGVVYKGLVFDSDSTAISNVGSLVLSFMAGVGTQVSYKTKDGKFYTISSLEEAKELYQVMYIHVQASFKAESLASSYYNGLSDSKLEDVCAELTSTNSKEVYNKFEELYTQSVKELKGA